MRGMLCDTMAEQGNALFRLRSFLPVALLPVGLVAIVTGQPWFERQGGWIEGGWHALLLLIAALGFMLRAHVIGHVADGTSGRNTNRQIATMLNVDGAYSLCRNPLYLGNFLIWLALAMMTESPWFVVVFVLFFALYYERVILCEEQFLLQQFGQLYQEWAASTAVFIPRLSRYRPSLQPVRFSRIFRKEYPGFINFALVICLMEVTLEYREHAHAVLSEHWLIFLCASLVIGFGLRTLRKHTTFFKPHQGI